MPTPQKPKHATNSVSSSQPAHTGIVINHAETHENRIHSDEIAAKFGFEGALVPGVTVFGLTSIALTKQFGATWLTGNTLHTRFLKPAYHEDMLKVYLSTSDNNNDNNTEARCVNKDQTLLCTINLHAGVPAPELKIHEFDLTQPITPADRSTRKTISWELIHEHQPFPVRPWRPSAQENSQLASEVEDAHSAFTAQGEGLVHPHFLLSHANQVLVDEFEMPAWIHVGSEIRLHQALKQDVEYRTFAMPIRKWKHKGHEFVTIYIAYESNGTAVTEILHTAIYRVAGA